MIIYGTSLIVGLLQGVLIHDLFITALVSSAVLVSMVLFIRTVGSCGSEYSIGVSQMPISVFKSEFDDGPTDETEPQSLAAKMVLVIVLNGFGILVGTIGSQFGF